MKILLINSSAELEKHFDQISTLFLSSFSKIISRELWEWAYLNNPFGDAVVALAYDADQLVGHYAVIPYQLSSGYDGISAYLSMTTMVAKTHTKHGLFKLLAEEVYAQMWLRDEDAFVFGFPNKNSLPGFRKRLGWSINDQVKIFSVDAKLYQIYKKNMRGQENISLDGANADFLEWRSKKPGSGWVCINGVYFKEYNGELDLMFDPNLNSDSNITVSRFNALIDLKFFPSDSLQLTFFNYPFGYRAKSLNKSLDFFLQMGMSDVF